MEKPIKKSIEKSMAMLLLMGGKSRRMGRDKAFLPWGDSYLWEKITGEMEACGPVYLSLAAGTPEDFPGRERHRNYVLLRDEAEGMGPMGGICSAFNQTEEEAFFVCACDLPRMDRRYIETLMGLWSRLPEEAGYEGLFVCSGERLQPTAGIYHRRLAEALGRSLREKKCRLSSFLAARRLFYLEEEKLGDLAASLANINTPEDYSALLKVMSSEA